MCVRVTLSSDSRVSSQITYPDFPLYEMLDQHRLFEPTILDDFDNLKVHVHVASYVRNALWLYSE